MFKSPNAGADIGNINLSEELLDESVLVYKSSSKSWQNETLTQVADDNYLALNGSNANQNIDIGDYDLTTTGNITASNLNISDWNTGFYKTGGVIKQYNPDYDEDFVFGSPQLAADGNIDHDNRMFFDKSKGAFRVGRASEDDWDDANVGTHSFASGVGTIASGDTSTAMGVGTIASGSYSTAMGINTIADGEYSTAVGNYSTASGTASFAAGVGAVKTSSSGSIAMGKAELEGDRPWNYGIISSGFGSIAMGYSSLTMSLIASGTGSIAMGYSARTLQATERASIAMGEDVQATARNAIALGQNFINNTPSSLAIGFGFSGIDLLIKENEIQLPSNNSKLYFGASQDASIYFDGDDLIINPDENGAGSVLQVNGDIKVKLNFTVEGPIINFTNLPTSDPINAGDLWNDDGTLKVSSGDVS